MSKTFLFSEVETFTKAELEAKVQQIKDDNDKEMALLIASFLPSEWDQMLEWLAAIISKKVIVAAEAIDLTLKLAKMAEIIANDLEADKLETKLVKMKAGEKLYIYTDVYEWLSGSSNHFTYMTEHSYVVK